MSESQITEIKGYNTRSMVFSDPKETVIPNKDPKKPDIKFRRVYISTKQDDGSVTDLIFQLEELFSYGVQENTSPETGKVTGYSFPICCWDKEDPTDEQMAFTLLFEKIVKRCKKHLIGIRNKIGKHDLEERDMKKFANCLWWKKDEETGKKVEGVGPTLYAKLMTKAEY